MLMTLYYCVGKKQHSWAQLTDYFKLEDIMEWKQMWKKLR